MVGRADGDRPEVSADDAPIQSGGGSRVAVAASHIRSVLFFVFLDVLIVIAGYSIAEVVYFRDRPPANYWQQFAIFLVTALVVQLSANRLLGLYGRIWRHAGIEEARQILLATLCSMAVLIALHPLGRVLRHDGNGRPQVPLAIVRLAARFAQDGAAGRGHRNS
jgi:hypothetical protein